MTTELQESINYAVNAHKSATRRWDGRTPYVIHPLWCAMTLLTETNLPASLREVGYQTLLWHDILEDTKAGLPPNTREQVEQLVQEMTFESFADEMQHVWSRNETARLLKLYDKVSNLLDGTWMSDEQWNQYVNYTLRLMENVEVICRKYGYGPLNVVKIARAICLLK
jgi:(p)ppGpp synthase/HD superfamily hydrolase